MAKIFFDTNYNLCRIFFAKGEMYEFYTVTDMLRELNAIRCNSTIPLSEKEAVLTYFASLYRGECEDTEGERLDWFMSVLDAEYPRNAGIE